MNGEVWEKELLAWHRWGARDGNHSEKAIEEHSKLKKIWEKAQPLGGSGKRIMELIIGLEICNWRLEESIIALCNAIGENSPPSIGIGHGQSLTHDRWKKVWAYYLSLKEWLSPHSGINIGHGTLLKMCDPSGEVQEHVNNLLGQKNELKELYVERLCLTFDYITSFFSIDSAQGKSYQAAVSAIEEEIKKHDHDENLLRVLELNNVEGTLQPCHHKVFRRFDIIISSIGEGKWRGAMPLRGTDGFTRADMLEKYLKPIEFWIQGEEKPDSYEPGELFDKIHESLGEPDNNKIFLASLLVSLLRSQQVHSRQIAEKNLHTHIKK